MKKIKVFQKYNRLPIFLNICMPMKTNCKKVCIECLSLQIKITTQSLFIKQQIIF